MSDILAAVQVLLDRRERDAQAEGTVIKSDEQTVTVRVKGSNDYRVCRKLRGATVQTGDMAVLLRVNGGPWTVIGSYII